MIKQRGQSLVEMAIITPLLIFMIIGVFEVGWVLRGYLVLINANREAARFSVRSGYLNFNEVDEPGWEKVKVQYLTSIDSVLPINLEDKGTLVLAYIEVNTGDVIRDKKGLPLPDCTTNYTATIHIPTTNPTFTVTYGEPKITHFDYNQIGTDLARNNREHNCTIVGQGGVARYDGLVIAESWYDQPMLFGFPLISNPLSDPVPMYAHTIFRRIEAKRGTGQEPELP